MTDALDAVIDAALQRALVSESEARQYFALAGVLDRIGRTAADDVRVGPLGASLLSTVSVHALADGDAETGLDVEAWTPGTEERRTEFVVAGALTALRRFDVDLDVVASQAGLSPARLDRYRESSPEERP
ncbi:hypothetical protein [Halobellus captivus]|uniref:hypothetical protein n=1 Tax=Halobellus captivus TaxID=2592614 RepID=UPI0011A835C8|nr:hypothetical protein [Halobellus captivus]